MNLDIFEELKRNFEKSFIPLNQALLVCSVTQDSNYTDIATSVHQNLDQCRHELRVLRKEVDSRKSKLHELEDLKAQCQLLSQHLQFALSNFPAKIPYKKSMGCPATDAVCGQGTLGPSWTCELPPSMASKCQYLNFLTVQEFEAVPKYMKGRLTYDKVNSVIEQLDRIFCLKYKILNQKKSSLNDVNRKRFDAFRLQENKDTNGVCFIVEKDISDLSSLVVDSAMRNILTILRHCSLIQEIRGGGYVRFAISSHY